MNKTNKTLISIILISLFLVSSAIAAPIIYTSKSRINTNLESNIIEVPVYIKDAVNLYAVKLDVSYDNPSILSYNDVVPGTLLSNGGVTLIDGKTIGLTTSSSGYIDNILVSRSSISTGVTGSGLLFTLKLNKLASGLSDLTLSDIELSDSSANAITNFNVHYLILWDDTDTGFKYPGQSVTFYASYEDRYTQPVIGTCTINLEGNNYQMTYDSANQLYRYSKSFSTAGDRTWNVICNNFISSSDKATISVLQCPDLDGDGYLAASCGGTDCNDNNPSIKPGAVELCNNIDDNCDGIKDNNIAPQTQSCTVGVGACLRTGTQSRTCSAGIWSAWSTCSAVAGTPTNEICNNIDDDCDGAIDDNIASQTQSCTITNGIGIQSRSCSAGIWSAWSTCTVTSCNTGYQIEGNTCVSVPCVGSSTQSCTVGTGACLRTGIQSRTCNLGVWSTWSTCSAVAGTPTNEICNNIDDDCDGAIDDNIAPQISSCSIGTGACLRLGTQSSTCNSGVWSALSTCTAVAGTPTAEICNNIDDNCDGFIDNDLIVSQSCTTGIGACLRLGTQSKTCSAGIWSAWSTCSAVAGTPTNEICNNIDDDCDGAIDNNIASQTQSCTITNGFGIQSRSCSAGIWSAWSTCTVTSCNTGYQIEGNTCVSVPCIGSSTQSCPILNGNGTQSRTCILGEWSAWNTCIISSCNNGYEINGTSCVPIVCIGSSNQSCSVGIGACSATGIQTRNCQLGLWSDWSNCTATEISPAIEACNNIDDDCDGFIDNNITSYQNCSSGVGACLRSGTQSRTCSAGSWGNWSTCSAIAGNPIAEKCNKIDDDCDGTTDENVCSNQSNGSSGGSSESYPSGNTTTPLRCIEEWSCSTFSECIEGFKERTCTDLKNCGTQINMPEIQQSCYDFCKNNIYDQGEIGIDCGGDCPIECQINQNESDMISQKTSKTKTADIILTEENTKKSEVILFFNNTGNKKKSGIQFNVEIRDNSGKIIADEFYGPIIIEENEVYEEAYSVPLYLLNKKEDYYVSMSITEKGKKIDQVQGIVSLDTVPTKVFFSRVNTIFIGIIIFVLLVIILFSRLYSAGDKK